MLLIDIILLLGALFLLVPIAVFCIECLAAIMFKPVKATTRSTERPRIAVLIPAHNEEAQIAPVIEEVQKQLLDNDLLLVIADNCRDKTAEIARLAGATVIERINKTERGKGYALDRGLQYLQDNPPEVVVFLDADCLVYPDTIANISCLARDTGRPVQAKYLMEQPNNPGLRDRISTWALQIKNRIRFLGLRLLGAHCLLTGSGMAFPWSVINRVSLVGAINADDTKLTVDLALTGVLPMYCEKALVVGRLMESEDAQSQRTRWEHGHLQMILTEVPRLLKGFWQQRRLALLVLALDIAVPPMSLLVMLWVVMTAIATLAIIFGASSLPALMLSVTGVGLLSVLLLIWSKFGREDLSLKDLISIPFYIIGKISIYLKFVVDPQRRWLKTERDLP